MDLTAPSLLEQMVAVFGVGTFRVFCCRPCFLYTWTVGSG